MLRHRHFVERSLVGALAFLKESIFSEEYAAQAGLLQSLDPRVKVATFLVFLTQILFIRDIQLLLFFYALCLLLAQLSRINLWFFIKRTWVFIPLFALVIAIPAVFSAVTPGQEVGVLNLGGVRFAVTRQGIGGATVFFMRVLTSVSFAVLLSITTRHFELLRVLRIFKIPQLLVMTVGMCYRYIYLFVEMLEQTYFAIKSRVGMAVRRREGQHLVAGNIAYLWQRSYQMHEQVYSAMLSRGYWGEPVTLNDFKMKARDIVWVALCAILMAAVLYASHYTGAGIVWKR